MVGVSRWLTRTVRIAKAVATRARSCCPVSSGQPPADPYAYRIPQEWRINSKCGDRIYRRPRSTGDRHGGHGEQKLPTVQTRCRFG